MTSFLIHLLGGITPAENLSNQENCAAIGEYHSYLTMKAFADQLNGQPADEWCKLMYNHICGSIKRIESATSK